MLTQICVFVQGVQDGTFYRVEFALFLVISMFLPLFILEKYVTQNLIFGILKKIKMILIHIAHSVVTTLPTYTRSVVEDFQCSFLMVSKMALRNMSRTRTRNFVLFFPAIRAIFLTTALLVKKKIPCLCSYTILWYWWWVLEVQLS